MLEAHHRVTRLRQPRKLNVRSASLGSAPMRMQAPEPKALEAHWRGASSNEAEAVVATPQPGPLGSSWR